MEVVNITTSLDIKKVFTYMLDDKDVVIKFIIGSIISIIPFVNIILYGYLLDVIKNSMNNIDTLPDFKYIEQFIKGIMVAIAYIIMIFIPYFIGIIVVMALSWILGLGNNNPLAAIVLIVGYLFIFLLIVILNILFIIGLCQYVETDKIGSIFNIGKSIEILKNTLIEQLKFYIVYIIVMIILSIVVYILSIICVFTIILIPLAILLYGALIFYSFIVIGYFIGKIYMMAKG